MRPGKPFWKTSLYVPQRRNAPPVAEVLLVSGSRYSVRSLRNRAPLNQYGKATWTSVGRVPSDMPWHRGKAGGAFARQPSNGIIASFLGGAPRAVVADRESCHRQAGIALRHGDEGVRKPFRVNDSTDFR